MGIALRQAVAGTACLSNKCTHFQTCIFFYPNDVLQLKPEPAFHFQNTKGINKVPTIASHMKLKFENLSFKHYNGKF